MKGIRVLTVTMLAAGWVETMGDYTHGAAWASEAAATTNAPAQAVAGEAKKAQTVCPVMGGAIDRNAFVEKDGQRIYICCKGCAPAIEKDFAKYAADMEKSGVAVEKVQTTCPVMHGRKIVRSLYVDHDGKRVYVCCKGCVAAVKKDPAKYVAELEKKGITLEKAPANAAVAGPR